MRTREAIELLKNMKWSITTKFNAETNTIKALGMAITALEKQEVEQEVDKCCETCKYEHLELDAYPCCDCIRAKDHYEPHTEEES